MPLLVFILGEWEIKTNDGEVCRTPEHRLIRSLLSLKLQHGMRRFAIENTTGKCVPVAGIIESMLQKHRLNIDGLYPELFSEERAEAIKRLNDYLEIVWRIYKRKEGIADDDSVAQAMDHSFSEDEE